MLDFKEFTKISRLGDDMNWLDHDEDHDDHDDDHDHQHKKKRNFLINFNSLIIILFF